MMYELLCGKIDEESFERDKDNYVTNGIDVSPYEILSDRFEICSTRGWTSIVDSSKEFFVTNTWMDWGSYFCRGNYDQMKKFLEWAEADAASMIRFEALPKDGDYGFVFIEDY